MICVNPNLCLVTNVYDFMNYNITKQILLCSMQSIDFIDEI